MSHYPCILNVRKRSQYDRSNLTLAKERCDKSLSGDSHGRVFVMNLHDCSAK